MSNVLVTGATGFIGRQLTQQLVANGDEVTCLVRPTSNTAGLPPAARLVLGDVTQPDSLPAALAGIDVVYHLGGVTTALRRDDYTRVNEHGTRHVAAACAARTTPPTLLLVSSLAASHPSPGNQLATEEDVPAPVSYYGQSKLAAELAAREFADRIPLSIVRPPMVFGPGDRMMLPIFASIRNWGIHMLPTWTDPRYSLIHVDDLCRAVVDVAHRGARVTPDGSAGQGVYFAAAEEVPTYAELGRRIAQALGRRLLVIRNAPLVVWTIAGVSQAWGRLRGKPLPFNWDKAREATAGSWVCSPAKIQKQLQFTPAAPLTTRLQQTAQWYLQSGWL